MAVKFKRGFPSIGVGAWIDTNCMTPLQYFAVLSMFSEGSIIDVTSRLFGYKNDTAPYKCNSYGDTEAPIMIVNDEGELVSVAKESVKDLDCQNQILWGDVVHWTWKKFQKVEKLLPEDKFLQSVEGVK